MMRAKAYFTKADAESAIAQCDAALGYPRTEPGVKVGGGKHMSSITLTTCAKPVELADGTFAVDVEQLKVRFTIPAQEVVEVTPENVKGAALAKKG